ncbi:NAD(P)/FAD-dependent oxidoreductase [Actinosynnema sp.]|uniref:NAD(P)/FAD-dependent oxidoreductase n=1 Tax=Actinosynnema sp. TaxID=1872144 RepID=UPI003F82DA9E
MENTGGTQEHDVVVIGGGAAGLSGAVALARSRRSVLVIDSGAPRNAPAEHMHNFLSRDGLPPRELLALGRDEVVSYGGKVVSGLVSAVERDGDGFLVRASSGVVRARKVLVATGLVDVLPDVPGLRERWGRDVLHCPFCHGWEVRDQRIGVLATGPMAAHQVMLFRQLSDRVVLLRHTGPALGELAEEQVRARGVETVDGVVEQVVSVADRLVGVRLAGDRDVALDALVVAPRFVARADFLAPLGLHPVDEVRDGHVIGSAVPSGPAGATAVPGVRIAGNATDLSGQVITSAAAGLMAGAALNGELVTEETAAAVAALREPFSHEAERRLAEVVAGGRQHGL